MTSAEAETTPTRDQPIPPLYAVTGALLVGALSFFLIEADVMPENWVYGGVLAVILLLIATEYMHKTIVVMIGSGLCLFLAAAGGHLSGGHGGLPPYVEMVEWNTVAIIVGASIFVELASRSGIFTYISIKLLKLSRGRPLRLLIFYSVLTLLFSAFLDNITAMIIVGSLTIIASEKLSMNPLPFVLTEAIMTNLGGTLTLISSVPNIIIGTKAGISYMTFVYTMSPYVAVATVGSIAVSWYLFPETFQQELSPEQRAEKEERVKEFNEWDTVDDPTFFNVSVICVICFIAAFALHGVVPVIKSLPLEWVALGFATLMLIIYPAEVEDTLEKVEWSLIFFFIGLFTVIGVMQQVGVLGQIGLFLKDYLSAGAYRGPGYLMWASTVLSSVTANIPLAAMMSEIIGGMELAMDKDGLWWGLVLGSNLGGNITPIGSASTMVGVTALRREGISLSFMGFVRKGLCFASLQLVLATAYLAILVSLL
jgi:Na+/H+ antiporter NhaD/arsenite permease-like protein